MEQEHRRRKKVVWQARLRPERVITALHVWRRKEVAALVCVCVCVGCDEACEGTLGTLILSLLVQTANCVSQPVCGERERET